MITYQEMKPPNVANIGINFFDRIIEKIDEFQKLRFWQSLSDCTWLAHHWYSSDGTVLNFRGDQYNCPVLVLKMEVSLWGMYARRESCNSITPESRSKCLTHSTSWRYDSILNLLINISHWAALYFFILVCSQNWIFMQLAEIHHTLKINVCGIILVQFIFSSSLKQLFSWSGYLFWLLCCYQCHQFIRLFRFSWTLYRIFRVIFSQIVKSAEL